MGSGCTFAYKKPIAQGCTAQPHQGIHSPVHIKDTRAGVHGCERLTTRAQHVHGMQPQCKGQLIKPPTQTSEKPIPWLPEVSQSCTKLLNLLHNPQKSPFPGCTKLHISQKAEVARSCTKLHGATPPPPPPVDKHLLSLWGGRGTRSEKKTSPMLRHTM